MTAVDHRRVEAQARAAQDEDFYADLLPEAAELVITAGHASPAMLGRKMRLGDAMACDLLVELEELEVVGPAGADRAREVLVDPDRIEEVLAWIAEQAGADGGGEVANEDPPVVAPVVSLVKPASGASPDTSDPDGWWDDDQPGGELVVRPDDDLELYQPGELAPYERERQHLVTRTIQTARRGRHWATHQPTLVRGASITVQAPRAGGRLIKWAPRGAKRAGLMVGAWVNDSRSSTLLAKHSEAGEGESYARVADARVKANLAGRRATLAVVAGLLVLLALAWWAPVGFAGALAALVFTGALALAVQHRGQELLWGLAFTVLLAWLAWWQGPRLAALVPYPPEWFWWVAGSGLVVTFGLLGRQEDQPLVEMPATEFQTDSAPDRPTATMVIDALCRIGVPGMTLAATGRVHEEVRVRAPGVARSSRGYTIELELPPGVTAGDVMDKREELAGALRRKLGCVWPSRGADHPGHLRLFLSDIPMATAPQPNWPLAEGRPIDVFDLLPLVTDQEGRWVDLDVTSTHTVIAGASGFGKSVTLRHLAVALSFDPRARLYVFDGKISGDLDPVRKLAHAYYEGADEDDVAEQLAALRGLEKEMRRRARFLRDLPVEERSPKVTSALASKYPHLSPIFALFDECQEYTEYGTKGVKDEMAIRTQFRTIITRISRLGRSAGIFLVLVSQKPDAEVLPTAIMGNCSNRLCFKVTEQNHNDQVLGTGAYKAGLKATLFSTDDRGLAWLKAAGDPQVVRGWSEMVDLQAGYDLAEIAYQLRKARNLLTGQAADDGIVDAEVVYDIVADAEHAMASRGCGKAQWGELVSWLQELRGQYADLTEETLSASIRTAGIRAKDIRSGGSVRKGVYLSDLRKRGGDDDGM